MRKLLFIFLLMNGFSYSQDLNNKQFKFSESYQNQWLKVEYVAQDNQRYIIFGNDHNLDGKITLYDSDMSISKTGKYTMLLATDYYCRTEIFDQDNNDKCNLANISEETYSEPLLHIIEIESGCILGSLYKMKAIAAEWSSKSDTIIVIGEDEYINIDPERKTYTIDDENLLLDYGVNNLRLCKMYKYPQYNYPLFYFINESYHFSGNNGSYPIKMSLHAKSTGEIEGWYSYLDENGEIKGYISLQGILDKNQLILTEKTDNHITGYFRLSLENEKLSGVWFSADKDKEIIVHIERTS